MLFNSIHFAVFLPIVFIFYWIAGNRSLKFQNLVLLVSSYYFYAQWDWRFLFLLIFSTLLDFFTGIEIHKAETQGKRKFWLWLSIAINLGFLGVFKYYNFFISSFEDGLSNLGIESNFYTLSIILPVGISFYTFHGLSYIIDIYYNRINPERNFTHYSIFVSFFPLLVAGPIERGPHLLPQIRCRRQFDYLQAVDSLKQILWGLFKKIVIADNCAETVNRIFDNYQDYSGSTLVVGAFLFAFQIYCDFSGYSDIALGTGRLFGIELLKNFSFPYFSRDIAEFWRRWYISLSSWFKDYVYIPLGGSKGGVWMKIRNTFIIFLLSGLWHGANWTFIFWGLLNAVYIMPSILRNTNRSNLDIVAVGKSLPSLGEFFSIIITFSLTSVAWIFFRAENIQQAIEYISRMFFKSLFSIPSILPSALMIIILFFIIVEWLGREDKYAIEKFALNSLHLRYAFYIFLMILIFVFAGNEEQFIYFQF